MTAPVFANSAFVDAPERFILRGGRWRQRALWVRYGLFLSPRVGPVLIDTGYTDHSVTAPGRSLGLRLYGRILRPRLVVDGQPEVFLARHRLRPEDVTRVVVTHFHVDHVSGLALFPKARFVASGAAWNALRARGGLANLRHGVFPELLPPGFADRMDLIESAGLVPLDFSASGRATETLQGHDLFGDGAMLALPLPGHAEGHFGLVFPQLSRPLLYGVDAQWLKAALPEPKRPGYPAQLIAADPAAIGRSTDLVEAFGRAGGDVVLCHDPEPTHHDLAQGKSQ
ncbi:MAG: MBL fold metallo-hydrolase [Pseudorhodobacter sp.]